jgi:DNA invertase Pin-like site-specific DNA recombinase
MTPITKSRIRCAIYTRKSSEEGLEQSFNSLQAQREACEAYITSQRHEGWHVLGAHYDDGGFSGGSMERPALHRLLEDIAAGKVDTVVVYKVDRLTRSLADFAKIIEIFDTRQVSFVSVTQQFNTTTSMGRLTLNVLLSFAQFEREVTGERIRDKIAASKRKGMWMGGNVPLGYDLKDRKLTINAEEAKVVREIYRQYLRFGCVSLLKEYLDQSPIRSKVRLNGSGIKTGGQKFSRGALYQLLKNHLYVGEIAHRGKVYPGEHEAIIERELWQKAHQNLAENRQGERKRKRTTKNSLLTGLLFDEQGNRYTPTHAVKEGKRYRYYTSQAVIHKRKEGAALARIPAHELERAVADRVLTLLSTPHELVSATRDLTLPEGQLRYILEASGQITRSWEKSGAQETEKVLQTIIRKVVVQQDSLQISLDLNAFINLIHENKFNKARNTQTSTDGNRQPQVLVLACPFRQARRGKELRLVIGENRRISSSSTIALVKGIVRARHWYAQVVSGKAGSITELAKQAGVTSHYVRRIFSCALLAPDLVEVILSQRHSPGLTLSKLVTRLPLEWEHQREIIA